MKQLLIALALCSVITIARAEGDPPLVKKKPTFPENARYVFVDSDIYFGYMVDTKTGRLWRIVYQKNGQPKYYLELIPYKGPQEGQFLSQPE